MNFDKLKSQCTVIGQTARRSSLGVKWTDQQVFHLEIEKNATGQCSQLTVQGEPGMVFDPRLDYEEGVLGNESGCLFKILEIVRNG